MASVTKDNDENRAGQAAKGGGQDLAVTKDKSPAKDDVRELDVAKRTDPRAPGLFSIYKKGQGYWTRMGTLVAVGVLLVMLAYTLYEQIPASFFINSPDVGRTVGLSLSLGFLVITGGVALWLMNKPSNVDFLIATDSEMKKVNWTSRKELIGSSKVVIAFMFLIAIYLFVNDIAFGYLMYWIGVLRSPPLGG